MGRLTFDVTAPNRAATVVVVSVAHGGAHVDHSGRSNRIDESVVVAAKCEGQSCASSGRGAWVGRGSERGAIKRWNRVVGETMVMLPVVMLLRRGWNG
jgi:hypothetical protein